MSERKFGILDRCSARSEMSRYPYSKPCRGAVVAEREGQLFCSAHDPVRIAAREARRRADQDADAERQARIALQEAAAARAAKVAALLQVEAWDVGVVYQDHRPTGDIRLSRKAVNKLVQLHDLAYRKESAS